MKNNASNPSIIQALQAQAQQLLPVITQSLLAENYREIIHQRLSQQSGGSELDYQGLTRAQHRRFGQVMIKWALTNHNLVRCQQSNILSLNHEITVLKFLNSIQQNQPCIDAIAPSIWAHHCLDIQILEENWQLTILTMPYYCNHSLATQLKPQQHLLLTNRQKHHFITKSASLIAHLHKAGWLHNDIKPSNILLEDSLPNNTDNSGITFNLLLTDFALAKHIYAAETFYHPAGTPAYFAPERWQGQGATVQSDIYAFGVMMYELLMGERPFKINIKTSEPLKDWATQHCQQPIPKLPEEYNHYQHIIDKALAKLMEARYKNMDEVLRDLESLGSR